MGSTHGEVTRFSLPDNPPARRPSAKETQNHFGLPACGSVDPRLG